jgi:Cys-tRNA(Pro) deacylase
MSKILSPSAQKVQDALQQLGSGCQVIEFNESTRTAEEAAARCGCQLGQIVKSLIFKGKTSARPVLVLTSGSNRVDEKLLAQAIGEKIGRADPDFVRSATGFAIGGVSPLGHAQPIATYLDEDLLQYPTIWAAAGTPNAVFEVTPEELTTITGAKILKVNT